MLLLVVPAASALSLGVLAPKSYIVGYEDGSESAVFGLLRSLDVRVERDLGAVDAVVTTPTLLDLASLLRHTASYVEPNSATRHAGSQWDGAQWNAAQWNGAQWDGAQWDGAQWNGAQWDGDYDPGAGSLWGLAAIRGPLAWAVEPGHRSATLCVVDSGVDLDHPDLAANAGNASYNAINGTAFASDDAGHGTHVAGIAAAVHGNGLGVAGVSNSRIISAKVLGADGKGTVGNLVLGMTWCADQRADVVLLALSVDGEARTVERAITYLLSKNVVVVASAGNSGCSACVSFPASDPRVIAVAAVDEKLARASFSSAGAEVALAAPGVGIVSTFDQGKYASGSGTSQAAAYVAGAAVLLRERTPGMAPAAVRERLTFSAHDVGATGRDDATGAGVLDVAAAISG